MPKRMDFSELHWLLAVVQSIDVGIVVLDLECRVQVWNSFMENRSGVPSKQAIDQSFFELFPEVERPWFTRKVGRVVALGTPAFTIWKQRPYLVHFNNYQPITGQGEFMYQNTTLLPLRSSNSEIHHVCLVIYDLTDVAINSLALQKANQQLQHLSRTDHLTQLYNRGHWEQRLQFEYSRHGNSIALLMLDIDHFKSINDRHGHQAGDAVIKRVSELIHQHVRDSDVAGRYGGEEFAILLPHTDLAGARTLAERLRQSVEEQEVIHNGQVIAFTISLGIACLDRPARDHRCLIEWADQALYASKRAGRNRVSTYAP
ncbi:sensor domain-containing diguanylate cyclase [Pseudomonas protegens]|uniref:sensor domain-containing diguanylate cyclase n=1 Tax=Pseudomonas TaxID=286 RepID=UPI001B3281BC|nr:sensor domain-containing diguanylate cyclase [Pseudomonas protegens]MBP5104463.1 diguanylate cyclase [Pseudomonas protegens]MBP5130522.1 diguanylate cyclase [Pseudomonas protegens]MBP5147318.1 diguanylate cyclase [Pseudomonas protegens]